MIGENRAADPPLKRAKVSVKQWQYEFKVRERDMIRLFGTVPTAHHRKFGRTSRRGGFTVIGSHRQARPFATLLLAVNRL